MSALYVKDDEVFRLAEQLAVARGVTKATAVKLALKNELARNQTEPSIHDRIAEFRRTSSLRLYPEVVIDKAFYDSLNDEEED